MRSVIDEAFGQQTIVETVGTDVAIGFRADVTPVLERNKRAQSEIGIRAEDEMTPVCSIPVSLLPMFKAVHGLDFNDPDDFAAIVSLIERDPDLRHLRTNSKVICG